MRREEIISALHALGGRLAAQGIEGELYALGGAAIAIAFDARRATRDIDAVFEPKQEIYAKADEVGKELGTGSMPRRDSSSKSFSLTSASAGRRRRVGAGSA